MWQLDLTDATQLGSAVVAAGQRQLKALTRLREGQLEPQERIVGPVRQPRRPEGIAGRQGALGVLPKQPVAALPPELVSCRRTILLAHRGVEPEDVTTPVRQLELGHDESAPRS
jgi:hypothetical protein